MPVFIRLLPLRKILYQCFFWYVTPLSNQVKSKSSWRNITLERPVHFSVITLLLTGASLLGPAYYHRRQDDIQSLSVIENHKSSIDVIQPTSAVIKYARIGLENLRHLHPSFPIILLCIGLRTWLYWAVIRTSQCSRAGIEVCFLMTYGMSTSLHPN